MDSKNHKLLTLTTGEDNKPSFIKEYPSSLKPTKKTA